MIILRNNRGFTLIELVTVMIIIGILSATILPKFFSSSGYEEYTYRSEIISFLRSAQLRSMQQVNNASCNVITVTSTSVSDNCGNQIIIAGHHQVTFSTNNNTFTFNHQGITGSTINITVTGSKALVLIIESQGYVHAI